MSNPKTEITGEVQTIEEKVGKKNPWYIVTIIATLTGWDGNTSEGVYQLKAFGKSANQAKGLAVGDYITVKCEVLINKWTKKETGITYNFLELSADSIEVLNNAVPVEPTGASADGTATETPSDLPF